MVLTISCTTPTKQNLWRRPVKDSRVQSEFRVQERTSSVGTLRSLAIPIDGLKSKPSIASRRLSCMTLVGPLIQTLQSFSRDDCKSLQREAILQVGPEGTLVAILWCDSAGEIVRRVLADREISVGDVFVSGSTILGVRDAEGQDRWFRLNNGLDDSVAAGLAGELRDAVFSNAKVPFSGSFKSVTNTHQWTALGRMVRINNRATPTDYDDEEFSEYRSRPMSVIPTVHLKKASDVLEYAERQRDRFVSLISEHPVDDRVHSYREIFSDERFMCAFRWAGLVGLSIDGLVSSFGTEVIGKAIGRDIDKIAGTIFACQGMLCGSVPSKSMADRIVLLVSSQDRILPARVLRRLTKGLRRLLSDELALRSEDMGNTRPQSRE